MFHSGHGAGVTAQDCMVVQNLDEALLGAQVEIFHLPLERELSGPENGVSRKARPANKRHRPGGAGAWREPNPRFASA